MSTRNHVTASGKTRILIVDDHEAIRSALTALSNEEPDLVVAAIAASAAEALEVVTQEAIDLALVDISLGETSGLDLASQLRARYPQTCVLIPSMHEASVYGARAERAGAAAYVCKQNAPETLIPTIRRVLLQRPS